MARPRKSPQTVLAHKKAAVSVHVNGVSIEVGDVPAEDSGLAVKELLDVFRTLRRLGYDELIQDAGGVHGGAFGDIPEDDDIDTATDPPQFRRIGF